MPVDTPNARAAQEFTARDPGDASPPPACRRARSLSASIARRSAAHGGDPAELSEDLGGRRPLRPVARGSRTVDPQQELFRQQVLLQFRLRQPAQPGGDGRQSVGPRAAARRDARLHAAAQRRLREISQGYSRPRPPIPRPTRPNSATQANDQLRAPEPRTAAGRHAAVRRTIISRRRRGCRCRHFARRWKPRPPCSRQAKTAASARPISRSRWAAWPPPSRPIVRRRRRT